MLTNYFQTVFKYFLIFNNHLNLYHLTRQSITFRFDYPDPEQRTSSIAHNYRTAVLLAPPPLHHCRSSPRSSTALQTRFLFHRTPSEPPSQLHQLRTSQYRAETTTASTIATVVQLPSHHQFRNTVGIDGIAGCF